MRSSRASGMRSQYCTETKGDVQVEGPAGHQVHSSKALVEDKFDFTAARKGLYKFCFFNRNSMHETVDFDVHVGYHILNADEEHVKDGMCAR